MRKRRPHLDVSRLRNAMPPIEVLVHRQLSSAKILVLRDTRPAATAPHQRQLDMTTKVVFEKMQPPDLQFAV
ncbi:MAG: hypothetical protein ACR2JC_05615 [Chloroflexota bacterium]